MSFVGNRGTFTRGYKAIITDVEFLYHLLYLIICCLGVFLHVFFYSLLVCERTRHINNRNVQRSVPARLYFNQKCLPPALRSGLQRRDLAECHQKRHPQRPLHCPHRRAGSHPRLSLLHRGLYFLQRRLPLSCGQDTQQNAG